VGQLTPEEATAYPYSNILLRALGQNEELEVDILTRPLPPDGKLLLCSDGLSGFVPHPLLQEIVTQEGPLEKIADELFESAMAAGGYDNITAIIVEFAL
jgi:protein phosphatase